MRRWRCSRPRRCARKPSLRAIGAAASLELGVRVIHDSGSDFDGSELYGFADKGRVEVISRFGLPRTRATLASAGLGVRAAWKKKTLVGVEAAYGVQAPRALDGDVRVGFNLRIAP